MVYNEGWYGRLIAETREPNENSFYTGRARRVLKFPKSASPKAERDPGPLSHVAFSRACCARQMPLNDAQTAAYTAFLKSKRESYSFREPTQGAGKDVRACRTSRNLLRARTVQPCAVW